MFNGQLNQNVITASMYNMIISQTVFNVNVASASLADEFRVDGTLFGDTKLFISLDTQYPITWATHDELSPDRLAPNLLELNRNKSMYTQAIQMGIYKYVPITIDQYLSKQAFMGDGTFSDMIGQLMASLNNVKKIYDNALINNIIGTHKSAAKRGLIKIKRETDDNIEVANRMTAQKIAKELEILKAELQDNSRDFNELNYLRSHSTDNLIAVWNINQKAKITKMDLPSLFHNAGIADTGFSEKAITQKWFGDINTTKKAAGPGVRFAVGGWYKVQDVGSANEAIFVQDYALLSSADKAKCLYFNEGDELPVLTGNKEYYDYTRGLTVKVEAGGYPANHSYTENPDVLFVLMDRDALQFMSAFSTGTEFFNALSLTSNHYLIFGHNDVKNGWLKDKPFIRVELED